MSIEALNRGTTVLGVPLYSFGGNEAKVRKQAMAPSHVLIPSDYDGTARVAYAEDIGPLFIDRVADDEPQFTINENSQTMWEIREAICYAVGA